MLSLLISLIVKPLIYLFMLLAMVLVVFQFYPYTINYKKFKTDDKVISLPDKYIDVQTEENIVLKVVERNKPNEKPSILFLHGFCETAAFTWHNQIDHFSALGYHVIAPDLRGYNDSSKPLDVDSYLPSKLISDVEVLIKKLTKGKVVLVAHDWGAIIASWFAALKPEHVEKLVLLNMGHSDAQTRLLTGEIVGFGQLLKSWYIFFFQIPYLAENRLQRDGYAFVYYFGGMEELSEKGLIGRNQFELDKIIFDKQLPSAINYYRGLFKQYLTQGKMKLDKFKMPVLLLFGTADAYLCHESADLTYNEYIDESVKSQSKVVKLPNIGHWVTLQASKEVNENIQSFIQ